MRRKWTVPACAALLSVSLLLEAQWPGFYSAPYGGGLYPNGPMPQGGFWGGPMFPGSQGGFQGMFGGDMFSG